MLTAISVRSKYENVSFNLNLDYKVNSFGL